MGITLAGAQHQGTMKNSLRSSDVNREALGRIQCELERDLGTVVREQNTSYEDTAVRSKLSLV